MLFAADPTGFKEISRVQVCGNTWCNPAFADSRLYLRDGLGKKTVASQLYCVELLKQ